jgi:spore germination cell wall hydrolase CwlJ-like protein
VQRAATTDERTCLIRAMYFESNRSSGNGLLAVGTVVMNRVASPRYPHTICGVVGQPGQFASGVLTRPMNRRELPPVERAADAVLKGERYAPVGDAMHFHVAGLRIPYHVQYMTVAGGNAFYRKLGGREVRYATRSSTGSIATAQAPAAKTPDANATTLTASASGPTLIEQLYDSASAAFAGGQSAKTCSSTAAAFGATSLACEDEAAGR